MSCSGLAFISPIALNLQRMLMPFYKWLWQRLWYVNISDVLLKSHCFEASFWLLNVSDAYRYWSLDYISNTVLRISDLWRFNVLECNARPTDTQRLQKIQDKTLQEEGGMNILRKYARIYQSACWCFSSTTLRTTTFATFQPIGLLNFRPSFC
jgi:hypothetical protein